MRDIKLRAWVELDKALRPVCEIASAQVKIILNNSEQVTRYRSVCVLEQFTDLLDKNGKEVYEGDVVKLFTDYSFVVIYKHGSFGYMSKSGDYIAFAGNKHFRFGSKSESAYIEVIGNVHQNSDILEKK